MNEDSIFDAIEDHHFDELNTFFQNPPTEFNFYKKKFKDKEYGFIELIINKIIFNSNLIDIDNNLKKDNIQRWEVIALQFVKIVKERNVHPLQYYLDWSLYKYISEIKDIQWMNEDFCIQIFQSNFSKNIFYVEKIMIDLIRFKKCHLCKLFFERYPEYLTKDISNDNKKISLYGYSIFASNKWASSFLFEETKKKIDTIPMDIIIQNFVYSCNLMVYFKEYALFFLDYLISKKVFIFEQLDKTLLIVLIENSMEEEALKLLDLDCYPNFSYTHFFSPPTSFYSMKFGIKKDSFMIACEKNYIHIIKKLLWKLPLTKFILLRRDYQNNIGELMVLTSEYQKKVLEYIQIKEEYVKESLGIQYFSQLMMNKIYSYVSYH
jgi:hypothetical protein